MRPLYSLIVLIAVSLAWSLTFRKLGDTPLTESQRAKLNLAAFLGAMLGAKLPFLFDLGWEGIWTGNALLADGKTILGGIAGGYAAVEIAKETLRIRITPVTRLLCQLPCR